MKAVVQYAAFLELSGDDVVNPDAAVRELEALSQTLEALSSTERRDFVRFVEDYAESEHRQGQSQSRVEFIKSLPEALGLIEG